MNALNCVPTDVKLIVYNMIHRYNMVVLNNEFHKLFSIAKDDGILIYDPNGLLLHDRRFIVTPENRSHLVRDFRMNSIHMIRNFKKGAVYYEIQLPFNY